MSVSEYPKCYGHRKHSVLYQAEARRIRGSYQVNVDLYIPEDTLIEYKARFKHMLPLDKLVSEILIGPVNNQYVSFEIYPFTTENSFVELLAVQKSLNLHFKVEITMEQLGQSTLQLCKFILQKKKQAEILNKRIFFFSYSN